MSLRTYPPPNVPPPAPFNRSSDFAEKVKRMKKRWGLNVAVETGTWLGVTTRYLAGLFDLVHTIELNPKRHELNKSEFKNYDNIRDWQGNSGHVIKDVLESLGEEDRCFVYLDAHWGDKWPIKEEILSVGRSKIRDNCVIVIDDFQIPGRKDIPFDMYGKNRLNLDYVIKELQSAFTDLYYEYYIPPRGKENTRGRLIAMPRSWMFPQ